MCPKLPPSVSLWHVSLGAALLPVTAYCNLVFLLLSKNQKEMGIWAKELWEPEGLRTPGKHGPLNQIRQGSWGLGEAEAAMVAPAWVYTISSAYVLWCWLSVLGRLLAVKGGGCPLLFCPFLRRFFYYWIASPSLDVAICAWFYCILLGPWEGCCCFSGE